jgi:hypothetical protein
VIANSYAEPAASTAIKATEAGRDMRPDTGEPELGSELSKPSIAGCLVALFGFRLASTAEFFPFPGNACSEKEKGLHQRDGTFECGTTVGVRHSTCVAVPI